MAACFSFTALRDMCLRYFFYSAGLKSTTTDLGDGTVMQCAHSAPHPWDWRHVPDLLFFGESYTSRPERSESFQAQCVMRVMEKLGVCRMRVVGLSYGGFVAYSMAAQFPEAVERLVIGCAGICMEEKDMEEGLFRVKSVDETTSILLAQTPEKMRELLKLSFYKPIKNVPSFFLSDFIEIFPIELAHRLKRHLEHNAHLVVMENTGHAIKMEKPKVLYSQVKSFLGVLALPRIETFGKKLQGILKRGPNLKLSLHLLNHNFLCARVAQTISV